MPIIDPQVQNMLRMAGIKTPDSAEEGPKDSRLDSLLTKNGLSLDNCLQRLADIADGGDTSAVRLRATETGLKMHGALQEKTDAPISVNIVINDSFNKGESKSINPILVPRVIQAA